ncbi:MAG: glucuronate isomerase [Chloroflexota bacterium]
MLTDDRLFSAETRPIAQQLYESVAHLPLICPHGHVDPRLFVAESYDWGTPVDLLIIPDHYVFRMLYAHGIPLEGLGIPRLDGAPVETDHRQIWQTFAEHFYLFRGTPTGIWLADAFARVFDIHQKLTGVTAQAIYDTIQTRLKQPEFSPRRLYERFRIEVLATTDAATATLDHHRAIRESGWNGRVIPTFRPDDVVHVDRPGWRENIDRLSDLTGVDIVDYRSYIRALETRRAHFRELGAVATDHDVSTPMIRNLDEPPAVLDRRFAALLRGEPEIMPSASAIKTQTMWELARMSHEDGMVMQLHVGAYRNHNQPLFAQFGRDMGADIPNGKVNFTESLKPLLNDFGNDPRFRLIVFTLDESTYSRELAPLAGHYPALLIGPPWWFHDSPNGMRRYFDRVMETAGIYNTAGFNDDTRAFPSIPARHDVWRRASADWLAGLLARGLIDQDDAETMLYEMAYGLAKRAYRLDRT